jgi:hypothetical protein
MPVSGLSTESYSTSSGGFRQRRATPQALAELANGRDARAEERTSILSLADWGDNSETNGDSSDGAAGFSYLYRPQFDLLGLMAATPGLTESVVAGAGNSQSSDFLDDLNWLYLSFPSEPVKASGNAIAKAGSKWTASLPRGSSSSIRAVNAAYESSLDFA